MENNQNLPYANFDYKKILDKKFVSIDPINPKSIQANSGKQGSCDKTIENNDAIVDYDSLIFNPAIYRNSNPSPQEVLQNAKANEKNLDAANMELIHIIYNIIDTTQSTWPEFDQNPRNKKILISLEKSFSQIYEIMTMKK